MERCSHETFLPISNYFWHWCGHDLWTGNRQSRHFGGDVAVLAQILQQTIQQLAVMQQTLKVAQGDSDLLRKVNRDIDSALTEIHAIQEIVRDTNEIGKTKNPVELLNRLRAIYGSIPRLGNIRGLELTDNVAGTALGVDNDAYAHAKLIDSSSNSDPGTRRRQPRLVELSS